MSVMEQGRWGQSSLSQTEEAMLWVGDDLSSHSVNWGHIYGCSYCAKSAPLGPRDLASATGERAMFPCLWGGLSKFRHTVLIKCEEMKGSASKIWKCNGKNDCGLQRANYVSTFPFSCTQPSSAYVGLQYLLGSHDTLESMTTDFQSALPKFFVTTLLVMGW